MGKAELEALAADIKAHGLRQPIVTLDGKVLDGRNRMAACERAGVEPRFEEWAGTGSPTAWVLSQNLHRRHLTESQRALVAARAKDAFEAEARARMLAGKPVVEDANNPGANLRQGQAMRAPKSSRRAASAMNISPRAVESASKVLKRGVPELAEAVERGDVAVSAAAAVADEPSETQRELVAAGPKAIRAAAKAKRSRSEAVADRPAPQAPAPQSPQVPITSRMDEVRERLARADAVHYRHFCTAVRRAIEATPPDVGAIRAAFAELDQHVDKWANGYQGSMRRAHQRQTCALKAARRSKCWPLTPLGTALAFSVLCIGVLALGALR
jgi:hypothetical protein